MTDLRTICVYCGSAPGTHPAHRQTAEALGRAMAQAGIGLVYGGGNNGLMGVVARSVLAAGGHVTGIIPGFLHDREKMLTDVQDMVVVPDMHTRKRLMFERADAFVALPGGIGTLEELVEQLTWVQLQQHTKPVLLADIEGFWQPLITLLAHMREQGFVRPEFEVNYLVAREAAEIIPQLRTALRKAQITGEKTEVDARL